MIFSIFYGSGPWAGDSWVFCTRILQGCWPGLWFPLRLYWVMFPCPSSRGSWQYSVSTWKSIGVRASLSYWLCVVATLSLSLCGLFHAAAHNTEVCFFIANKEFPCEDRFQSHVMSSCTFKHTVWHLFTT